MTPVHPPCPYSQGQSGSSASLPPRLMRRPPTIRTPNQNTISQHTGPLRHIESTGGKQMSPQSSSMPWSIMTEIMTGSSSWRMLAERCSV
jgi:hypothetical protein